METRLKDPGAPKVEIVSVDVENPLPDGVTVPGLKPHVTPKGALQVNETLESKPPCGVTVMVVVALCPSSMVSVDGEKLTV